MSPFYLIVVEDSNVSLSTQSHSIAFIRERAGALLPTASVIISQRADPASVARLVTSNKPATQSVPICVMPVTSPLFDERLIRQMVEAAVSHKHSYIATGAVPGTEPFLVSTLELINTDQTIREFFWDTQSIYNTNINISRKKREKVFLSLERSYPKIATAPLLEVLEFLGTKAGIALILSYGESVTLNYYSHCPLCNGKHLQALQAESGHPTTGFLTKKSSYYYYCLSCGVVFLNPQMQEKDLWRYYDTAAYGALTNQKGIEKKLANLSEENTSHLANYLAITEFIKNLEPDAKVIDLGAGSGEFCVYAKGVRRDLEVLAVDHRITENLALALRHYDVACYSGDFIIDENLQLPTASLITNWEVVEHIKLERLPSYLRKISGLIRPGGLYILSTPDFHDHYCRALDFWAMAPGEHLSVLSRAVLEPLLNFEGLEVIAELHEGVTVKAKDRWFAYGAKNHSGLASRAESQIVEDILQNDQMRNQLRDLMRIKNVGSELILVCKKI